MKKEITIRKATTKDVPAIVELWKELMDYHKKLDPLFTRSPAGHKRFAEFLTNHINNADSRVLIALHRTRPVGYCMATISKYPPVFEKQQYGELSDMAVTKKYRRRGIGKELIKAVRKWYAKKSINRIEARYSTANEVAAGFWAGAGFNPYLKTTFLET